MGGGGGGSSFKEISLVVEPLSLSRALELTWSSTQTTGIACVNDVVGF